MAQTPLTIDQFAQQVLFANSLEAKISAPGPLASDNDRAVVGAFRQPLYPTRPKGLELSGQGPSLKSGKKITFPSRSRLSDDRARGLVLHFFANHELLALELMALALLKWPDAPDGFRLGIVRTMLEEQSHMRLYLGRMAELQVQFGETRLNSFFWDCLKDLKTPAEFAASMAMTFEQANIDFARYYEELFRAEGDVVSAMIMHQVREEEIGHVRHGVTWFDRWRPRSESLFKEWQNHLTFPITPARAKGIFFDREGRIRAGLPEDFIDELEVHNQSKGRPPRIFWFNPGCEQEVESQANNWTAPRPLRALKSDYSSLLGLLAHESDIVLVEKIPSVEHLRNLGAAGFKSPEFVQEKDLKSLKNRKIWCFEPWGWSPEAKKLFAPLESVLLSSAPERDRSQPTASASVFSKSVAADVREILHLNDPKTLRCQSIDMLPSAISSLSELSPTGTVVLKSSFSASGRGMLRVKNRLIEPSQLEWAKNIIRKNGLLLAEPWLEKVIDLSAHVDIGVDGIVRFVGFTRFWTDPRGQYRGHILGRILDDCGDEVLERWHSERGWKTELQETALSTGKEIFQRGYYGPMGVDAFIYRESDELKLRPLVEVNPRWSMGRLALAIASRLAAKHCGIWIHVSRTELRNAGHAHYEDLVGSLQASLPADIFQNTGSKILRQGVFPLNDPTQASQSLALLVVGRDLRQCYDCLKSGGIDDPYLELQSKTGCRIC